MNKKPKFVVVVPRNIKTGNTAPAITTSVTYINIGDLNTNDKGRATSEAKEKSRLSDSSDWRFEIKES